MFDRLPLIALLLLASLPVAAASPTAKRNYGVSGFDRVRVDGPYKVKLNTGVAPFARATSSSNGALESVSIKVEGRTLVIRNNAPAWGGYPGEQRGPVEIEIGTHDLTTVWLNGPGMVSIDKAKGLTFDLNVNGAGAATIDRVEVDQMRLFINGSGTVRLAGRALKTSATISGASTLDGAALTTKDAVISAQGPSVVRLTASETAKVHAVGVSAVSLAGGPSCTVKTQGSASVAGCREGPNP